MSEKTVLKKKGVSERETDTAAGALPAYVRGIDAESLYFFLTLYRAGSLPRAAEQMGVSLSSANRMLAKLRTYWNDPLFTRSGFLMQPTESAKKRYARVLGLMNTLEDLQHEDRIDPLHLKRTVRLAMYDNAFTLGIASVFSEFEKRLPLVRFHVTQADEHLFDDLRANRLDLVFFARQGLHPQLRSIPLVTEPYVCVVRKGHPLTKKAVKFGSLDKADLDPWRQVLINAQPDRYRAPNSPANGWFNPTDPEKIALVVPFFLSVPLCLYETDCYAIVPKATAEMAFDGRKLDFLPITDKAPKLTVYMGWHVRTHTDPGMQIIRSTLKELVSGKLGQEK